MITANSIDRSAYILFYAVSDYNLIISLEYETLYKKAKGQCDSDEQGSYI